MKKIALFPKQIEFYQRNDEEVLLEAGIGFGKSRVASIWLAEQTQKYPNTIWIMAASNYRQLKTAVDREFEYYLNDVLGLRLNQHYRKINGSPIEYHFNNGSKIFGFSALNYETAFRSGNYNGAWGDEVDYWKPEAMERLRGRIRVFPELKRFTTSPNGFNHIYEDFYEKKMGPVISATSYENPTLSTNYFETLKKSYSPKLFEQEVLAKRVRLNAGMVYDEFNREIHVEPCKDILDETDQLYFFTDYNIGNYCGVYMFKRNDRVYAIGEEHLKFQGTRAMAEKVKAKWPNRPVIVIGDSTGNNKRDVAIDKTNYQHFRDAGLLTKNWLNPPVESRIINTNSRFYHKHLIIDPSCKTLIRDLELLPWKEDGSGIDKSNSDLSHASDAYTYGVYFFLPVHKPKGTKIKQVTR